MIHVGSIAFAVHFNDYMAIKAICSDVVVVGHAYRIRT